MPDQLANLERFWMPKLWHGMSFPAWISMLRRHGFQVSPSRMPLALMVTLFACTNSLSQGLQRILCGSARTTPLVAPPIFVIGHWRSGTTWLHELLASDPRHTAPTTYECFSPCHFLLSERVVSRWFRYLLPARRLPDRMTQDWSAPQEDEPALCNLGQPSPYWKLAFPNQPVAAPNYIDLQQLTSDERKRWCATLERFLRQITWLRRRRIVLKSPTHSFRIRVLQQHFPGSRFVYLVRDPARVIPSTMHLWRVMRGSQGLQVARLTDLQDEVFETFHRLDASVAKSRAELPAHRFAEVRYEDLRENPLDELQRIYRELDLGDFEAARDKITADLNRVKHHRPNQYQVDPTLQDRIRRECREYCDRYRYGK